MEWIYRKVKAGFGERFLKLFESLAPAAFLACDSFLLCVLLAPCNGALLFGQSHLSGFLLQPKELLIPEGIGTENISSDVIFRGGEFLGTFHKKLFLLGFSEDLKIWAYLLVCCCAVLGQSLFSHWTAFSHAKGRIKQDSRFANFLKSKIDKQPNLYRNEWNHAGWCGGRPLPTYLGFRSTAEMQFLCMDCSVWRLKTRKSLCWLEYKYKN